MIDKLYFVFHQVFYVHYQEQQWSTSDWEMGVLMLLKTVEKEWICWDVGKSNLCRNGMSGGLGRVGHKNLHGNPSQQLGVFPVEWQDNGMDRACLFLQNHSSVAEFWPCMVVSLHPVPALLSPSVSEGIALDPGSYRIPHMLMLNQEQLCLWDNEGERSNELFSSCPCNI